LKRVEKRKKKEAEKKKEYEILKGMAMKIRNCGWLWRREVW
jgi:hypothetical protein